MTAEALNNHAFSETHNTDVTSVTSTCTTAKIMPSLRFTAQEFVDYVENHFGRVFKAEQIEKNLQELRLNNYIRR